MKISFLQKLLAPVEKKSCAYVKLEHSKAIGLCQISVPETDRAVQWQLSSQKIVHPAEGELKIIDAVCLQMFVECNCKKVLRTHRLKPLQKLTIYPLYQLFQLVDLLLNAELGKNIIILYAVEELADAPERVGLDDVSLFLRKLVKSICFKILGSANLFLQKHDEERRHLLRELLSNFPR